MNIRYCWFLIHFICINFCFYHLTFKWLILIWCPCISNINSNFKRFFIIIIFLCNRIILTFHIKLKFLSNIHKRLCTSIMGIRFVYLYLSFKLLIIWRLYLIFYPLLNFILKLFLFLFKLWSIHSLRLLF